MNDDPDVKAGDEPLTGSVRRVGAVLLRTLRNRTELLGLELEEEGRWAVGALIWAASAIFLAVLTTTMVTVTVVLAVPDSARLQVMIGFSVVYLILAIGAVVGLKKHIRSRRPPLADTVEEIKKDIEWIQPRE